MVCQAYGCPDKAIISYIVDISDGNNNILKNVVVHLCGQHDIAMGVMKDFSVG